ncbi:MAG TPA: squalene/phytoene synthase family protein, partial [Xanthobacteraceae bacterium]|nr:squalene/phytoene synthase family protein [Xanthobacteraceae bacterium]
MSDIDQDYGYCETLVRDGDKDRFLADLFAPADTRPHLHALQAFNLEIASVRHRVTEPMAGEIRLQWWRDVIAGEGKGEGPVAAALLETVRRFELSGSALARIIDAQEFDLAEEPMAELAALETYAAETAGTLFQLSAQLLAGGDFASYEAASRSSGVAYGLATMRRAAVGSRAWKGQARIYLDEAMAKLPALPAKARPAFLPLALVPLYLAREKT